MIYDELIPKLQATKTTDEITPELFYEILDAVITSGMMISFNDKLLQLDKLSQHMSRVKENINNHIDHQLEQLLEDE